MSKIQNFRIRMEQLEFSRRWQEQQELQQSFIVWVGPEEVIAAANCRSQLPSASPASRHHGCDRTSRESPPKRAELRHFRSSKRKNL